MNPDLNGQELRKVARHQRAIELYELGIVAACSLYMIWIWGIEPFLSIPQYVHGL